MLECKTLLVSGCSSPILSQQPVPIPAETSNPTKTHSRVTSPEPLPVRKHILFPSTYQQLFPDKPEWVISDGRAGSRAPSCIRKRKGLHPCVQPAVLPVQAAVLAIFMPRRLRGTVVGKSRSEHPKPPTQSHLPCCLNSHIRLSA